MSEESSDQVEKKEGFFFRLKNKLKPLVSTRRRKILTGVATIVVLCGVMLAVPVTRYAVLSPFIKKDVTLYVGDADSAKPVSGVKVSLGSFVGSSDAKGEVSFRAVPVGEYAVKIEKKYYKSLDDTYSVPVLSAPELKKVSLKAVGREVAVSVSNLLSNAVVADAQISINGTTALTDAEGVARVVLPINKEKQIGKITKDGFNESTLEIVVEADDQKVAATLAPAGKVYFLSKRTGSINLMKSNLDGTNQEVALAGTGKEIDSETVLLAARDWRYLALFARRDSDKPKVYIFDTKDNSLAVADEGDAYFELVGWSEHRFIYKVNRNKQTWETKAVALKSYNAETNKGTTLDETSAAGTSTWDYIAQSINIPYIIGDNIVYAKYWTKGQYVDAGANKNVITMVKNDGSNRKDLKQFDIPSEYGGDISARVYEPGSLYFRIGGGSSNQKAIYYEYENGSLTPTSLTSDDKFYNEFYVTYLVSPSGKKVFWYEPRDGKNVLLVGDNNALNSKELGTDEYVPYGWYGDEYVLLTKKGSELFAMSADSKVSQQLPKKISDYHKPSILYPGYGYGYGGQ